MSASTTISAPPGAPVALQSGASVPEEWLIVATIPALTPAGALTATTIQRTATSAILAQVQAPGSETWHVETIYFVGAVPVPDVQLIVNVDGTPQPYTVLASSVLVTNFRAPSLGYSWRLGKSCVLTFAMANITAVGAAPIIVTFRVKVTRFMTG